jgi:hypothetical protein
MTDVQSLWLYYAFFLLIRIPANIGRCRIPLMRGPGYFFHTRVGPDFYAGPGRALLRNFRLRILLPFVLDAAALPLIYQSNHPRYLLYLAFADMVLALTNHVAAAKHAVRAAKPFEIEPLEPVSAVAFPLTTRRVGDYTDTRIEWLLATVNIACLAILVRNYLNLPWDVDFLGFFHTPILLIYLQAGLLLLKRALVAGRTALPRDDAEQYLAWREGYRRLFLKSCDAVRLIFSACMAFLVIDAGRNVLIAATGVLLAGWVIWYSRQSRQFLELHARTRPVRMPDTLEPQTPPPSWICYRPDTPLSFIKGPKGYALNLGNRRTQIGVLYVGGLAALWFRL